MTITTSENDIKERLSIAYLTAVAGAAGLQVTKFDLDKASIDAIVMPISGLKGRQVNFQLKATSGDVFDGDNVKFALPIKNYNDLRDPGLTNPHYLVVVHLPGAASDWLSTTLDQLIIHGGAYFANLAGLPETPNAATKTIVFPKSQVFDVAIISQMIHTTPDRLGTAHV